MLHIRYLIFLFFTLILIQINAQSNNCNIQISGQILDEHDKSPLEYAGIVIKETLNGAICDENGQYLIKGICAGKYTLLIYHLDCDTLEIKFEILKNIEKNFFLEHHTELLTEIQVKAQKDLEQPSQSSTKINKIELEKLEGKTLGDVLSQVTGVSTLKTGSTIVKPVINGLHSQRILIFQNGVRFLGQDWGTDHAPEIDPDGAQEIIVIKGAGAVKYGGDGIAGIVLINPSPLPISNVFLGKVSTGFSTNGLGYGANTMLEGGLKKIDGFGWRITGGIKQSGDLKAPSYNLSNTGFKEYNATTAVGFKKFKYGMDLNYSFFQKENGILSASHIGNITDLLLAINSEKPLIIEDFTYKINNPSQLSKHNIIKSNAYYRFKENLKLNIQYAFQLNKREEFDIRRGNRSDIPSLDLSLNAHNIETNIEHNLSKSISGTAGSAFIYQNNTNIAGTGIRPLIPNFFSKTFALFLFEKMLKPKYELEAGIRYEYNNFTVVKFNTQKQLIKPTYTFNNLSATIGGQTKIFNAIILKSNLGLSTRSPNVAELFSEGLHHGAAAIELGDSSLQSEKGLKFIQSIEGNVNEKWSLNSSIFVHYISNFIYLEPQPEPIYTIRGAFPFFKYKQTNALLYGTDAKLKVYVIPDLSFTIQGSFLIGKDLLHKNWLINMPSNSLGTSIQYTLNKGIIKPFYVDIDYSYTFRQKRYPDGDYALPPNGYGLLDIGLGTKIKIKKQLLGLSVKLENVTNQKYRDYLDRLRYYADLPGFNCSTNISYFF